MIHYKKKNKFNCLLLGLIVFINIIFFNGRVQAYTTNEQSLLEVKYLIQKNSIYDLPLEGLNSNNINEVIKYLKDPYSQYFTKEEFQEFVMGINQSFHGIGIYNESVPEGIKVDSFLPGSSAQTAGLKVGDIIISADGNNLKGLDLAKAVKYIKGESGTFVKLIVKRGESILNYNVERKEIKIPTVEGKLLENNVAYILIESFGEDTPELLNEKFKEMESKGAEKYIIDLRNNTGGYTNSAYDILGYFIDDNVATIMKDSKNNEYRYKALKHDYTINKDIILLVNEYTASASEILSAALKDYNKVLLIGNKTYGKGVQQTIFSLSNGDVIKLTTHSFYSPLGKEIHGVGITPNIDSGKVDPLSIAELLFSGKPSTMDKSHLVKIIGENKKEYYIDLNKAREKDYRKAFKHILDSTKEGNIFIGTEGGWNELTKKDIANQINVYFNDYSKLPRLVKSKEKATFRIKLNKDIDSNTVNSNTIKLINEETFEEIKGDFNLEKNDEIIFCPLQASKLQGNYILLVEGLKGKDGKELKSKILLPVQFQ
ncbi:S41 family peptidase [uncultured Clostridium sp.]|uniref:S41 family peptidase n=1 Tax=uncultured Clostridium sp. TaxID=59620 RepID=UPI0028E9162D|nr:S41 family peptidase [uncultured Clostridium sp.]